MELMPRSRSLRAREMSTKEEDEEEEEAVETDRRSEQTNVARGTDGGS